MDHIYDQLIFLNNNNYNISIFFIYDFGREKAYLKIKELKAKNIIKKIYFLKRNTELKYLILNLIKIKYYFFGKYFKILIGSSLSIEERMLLSCINKKKSTIYGVLPTIPPILNDIRFRNLILENQSYDNLKFKNDKDLFNKNSKEIINYKQKIYLLLYHIFTNYFIKYKPDHTALLSKYVNKNLVVCHFTPNLYSTFVLNKLYSNQKVITYNNITNLDNISKIEISDYILFIFAPTQIKHLKYLIKSISFLLCKYPINKILIRPHPRFQSITDHITNEIRLNYLHIECKSVSNEESLYIQTYSSKIILGYYSSSFHAIDTKKRKLLLIHKEWTEDELGYDDLNILVGFQFNYNKHFSIIDMNNNIIYANQEDQNIFNSKNFSECFMNQDKIFNE